MWAEKIEQKDKELPNPKWKLKEYIPRRSDSTRKLTAAQEQEIRDWANSLFEEEEWVPTKKVVWEDTDWIKTRKPEVSISSENVPEKSLPLLNEALEKKLTEFWVLSSIYINGVISNEKVITPSNKAWIILSIENHGFLNRDPQDKEVRIMPGNTVSDVTNIEAEISKLPRLLGDMKDKGVPFIILKVVKPGEYWTSYYGIYKK